MFFSSEKKNDFAFNQKLLQVFKKLQICNKKLYTDRLEYTRRHCPESYRSI